MISSLKTDLSELKEVIRYNIEHPSTNNNTESYQICLDLLTRFPLNQNMTTTDFLEFYNKSPWLQYVNSDSDFGLLNVPSYIQGGVINTVDNLQINKNSITYSSIQIQGLDAISALKAKYDSNIIKLTGGVDTTLNITNVNTSSKYHIDKYIYSNIYNEYSIYNYNDFTIYNTPKILDPRVYNVLQLPTSKLNYYINKTPFILKYDIDSDIISSSTHIFPKLESEYDIIVYPDKVVYMTGSKLYSMSSYKVFNIPSLELIESGSDIKFNIYNKLKLTRADIVGPNVVNDSIINAMKSNIKPVQIKHGFRCYNSNFYDIYMNSINKYEKIDLMIKKIKINNTYMNLYF